jgi:hypothetical protein
MFYGQGILPGNLPIYKDKINAIPVPAFNNDYKAI